MKRTILGIALLCVLVFGGSAESSPGRTHLTTISLDTLTIANGFPLDLGDPEGVLRQARDRDHKTTLQSGNDIVLALANGNGDIGYIGYVPAMIGRTQGIKFQ
jgi:ABC-type nitrate/sulfonate/bicarbonate transport system substrate-binding protein